MGFGTVECAVEQTGKEAALKALYRGQCWMGRAGGLSKRGKGRIWMAAWALPSSHTAHRPEGSGHWKPIRASWNELHWEYRVQTCFSSSHPQHKLNHWAMVSCPLLPVKISSPNASSREEPCGTFLLEFSAEVTCIFCSVLLLQNENTVFPHVQPFPSLPHLSQIRFSSY